MSSSLSLELFSTNISSSGGQDDGSGSGDGDFIGNISDFLENSSKIANRSSPSLVITPSSEDGFPEYFKIILHILYNSVLIAGVVGNSLVLYVIYSLPRMRTVTNCLLANLALGDLIIATVCVPFTYISIIFNYWPFGHFLCYFVSPFNAIGVLVSAFTLIALSIEKYVAIIHPLAPRLRKSRVGWVIVGIWVTAVVVASPIAFVSQVRDELMEEDGNLTLPICNEFGWENENMELTYSLALLMIQYFIPVCVLAFTYTRISVVVWGISHEKPLGPKEIHLNRSSRTDQNRSRKAVLLTLAVVIGYTLAWLPYHVNYLLSRHYPELRALPEFSYISVGCHWLAMSHCFYNPLIYAWINSSFKNAFKDVLYNTVCCTQRNGFDKWGIASSRKYASSSSKTSSTIRWRNYYRKGSCAPESEAYRKFSVSLPQRQGTIKMLNNSKALIKDKNDSVCVGVGTGVTFHI